MFDDRSLPLLKIITIGLLPGPIKRLLYCLKGYRIGRDVRFSLGSIIIAKEHCHIKSGSQFGFFSIIRANKIEIGHCCKIRSLTLIIANDIKIGNDVIISETAIIRASHLTDKSNLSIEDRVHIFPKTILDPSYPLILGEECGVGFYTNIYTHGSYKNILEGYKVTYGAVTIGKRVELAYNVFVSPGVTIGDDAIVAYGSYVNIDVPVGTLVAGLPAKIKRHKEGFAPPPYINEKLAIIREIINALCADLQYSENFQFTESLDNTWHLRKGGLSFRVYLIINRPIPKEANHNDVIILFSQTGIAEDIDNYRLQIFDLINYRCSHDLGFSGMKTKYFFGRYGIRFKVNYPEQ